MTDEELKALFERNEAKIDGLGDALRGEMGLGTKAAKKQLAFMVRAALG